MKTNIFLTGWLVIFMAPMFIACSKESNDSITNTNDPNTITMKNMVFSPSRLEVSMGTTVTWVNDDNMVHTVTSDDGFFSSGDLQPGQKFTYRFSDAGQYNYHCDRHAGMTGAVVVMGIR
mgnify:CR=1 FL=1